VSRDIVAFHERRHPPVDIPKAASHPRRLFGRRGVGSHVCDYRDARMMVILASFRLLPLPRPLAIPTRDEGDQTSAGQRSHLEITRRRQEVIRVDSPHLLRGRQFPYLASRWSRGYWCRYRLGSAWKPRPHCRPELFTVRHDGTARCARPATAVYTFTDRASPDCAHPGGRSVRFRTSFPTRRPARPGSVVGDR
jgi:hypothetical protein